MGEGEESSESRRTRKTKKAEGKSPAVAGNVNSEAISMPCAKISRFTVTKAVVPQITVERDGKNGRSPIAKLPADPPTDTDSETESTLSARDIVETSTPITANDRLVTDRSLPALNSSAKQYSNTVTAGLRPSWAALSAANGSYNPNWTISYGHSNGSSLVVRQLLETEDPDRHFVRKFSSACSSMAGTEVSAVPTRRSHWGRGARATWSSRTQFLLACIGYAVGLGNLWRFPYMCHKFGGGAFLVAYTVMLLVCGIPLMLMELAIGQFTRKGPYGAISRLCPLLKGVGLAPVLIAFVFCSYYNVVVAWVLRFMFASFAHQLPWNVCTTGDNSSQCRRQMSPRTNTTNFTAADAVLPSENYFYKNVLQMSDGIESVGNFNWPLVMTLTLAWIMVYFSLWKSIKSTANVLYCTVFLPYVLLLMFLGRTVSLPGAWEGLRYLFQPRWSQLSDPEVWMHAAAQTFGSAGVALGALVVFASYNSFDSGHLLHDTLIVSGVNALTSLIAGVVVFATLGNVAATRGQHVDHVIASGPGLVFILYPRALSELPMPQLWSFLFFFLLLCFGLDSQFATLEVVITTVQDCCWPSLRRKVRRHEFLVLIICVVSFLLGLPHVTQGGVYVFQLLDHYVAGVAMTMLATSEVLTITWLYGTERLCQDIQRMTGSYPSLYFRMCWRFCAPFFMLMALILSLSGGRQLEFGDYRFPGWSRALGWCVASLSILPVPLMAALTLYCSDGATLREKFHNAIKADRTVVTAPKYEPTVGQDDSFSDEMSEVTSQCRTQEVQLKTLP